MTRPSAIDFGIPLSLRLRFASNGGYWNPEGRTGQNIWNIADMSFLDAVQIVDLFHAKQRLWDVAKAIYGPGTDTAERWAKRRRDELDDGRIGALLAALRRHEGRDEARRCIEYVRCNRHRMQYPKFRATGLCVGSGVAPVACKADRSAPSLTTAPTSEACSAWSSRTFWNMKESGMSCGPSVA